MEKICYNWLNGAGSLRVEHSGRLSLDLGCNRCQSGAGGTIADLSNTCYGDPDFAFSDYISFALLKTVVSGKLGLRAHFHQQHLMGDGDIFIIFAGQKNNRER